MNFNLFNFFRRKKKMKIDPAKWKTDESRSNPMVVAQQYPDCPINEICIYMVVGFGSIAKQCEYLKISTDGESAECTYSK